MNVLFTRPPANAAEELRALVRRNAQLEDLGYSIETLEPTESLSVGSGAGLSGTGLSGTGLRLTRVANSDRQRVEPIQHRALVSLCVGGGQGGALWLEAA